MRAGAGSRLDLPRFGARPGVGEGVVLLVRWTARAVRA
jgi:hypothetical protein